VILFFYLFFLISVNPWSYINSDFVGFTKMVGAYLKTLVTTRIFDLLVESYKDQTHIPNVVKITKTHIRLFYGTKVLDIKISEPRI